MVDNEGRTFMTKKEIYDIYHNLCLYDVVVKKKDEGKYVGTYYLFGPYEVLYGDFGGINFDELRSDEIHIHKRENDVSKWIGATKLCRKGQLEYEQVYKIYQDVKSAAEGKPYENFSIATDKAVDSVVKEKIREFKHVVSQNAEKLFPSEMTAEERAKCMTAMETEFSKLVGAFVFGLYTK